MSIYMARVSTNTNAAAPHVRVWDPVNSIASHNIMSLIYQTHLCRRRLNDHQWRVCTGWWDGTPREEHMCIDCSLQLVEDEWHVVLEGP